MEILRTPDACFKDLQDYPFAPNYSNITTEDGDCSRCAPPEHSCMRHVSFSLSDS